MQTQPELDSQILVQDDRTGFEGVLNSTHVNRSFSEENLVVHNNIRITLLTSRCVRVEWSENKIWEDRLTLAVVNRNFEKVDHTIISQGNGFVLTTDFLKITCPNSEQALNESFTIEIQNSTNSIIWHFGETNRENPMGIGRSLDGYSGDEWPKDYLNSQVEGFISQKGWAVYDDSKTPILCKDLDGNIVPCKRDGNSIDFYFFGYGLNYKGAIRDASRIFGSQPLLPIYAFGYWYSRYWPYTDNEALDLIGTYDFFKLPIDVLVLDLDWHKVGWVGYTWNDIYFPNVTEFLKEVRKRGIHVMLNLHPGDITENEAAFSEMKKCLNLPSDTKAIEFDCSNGKFMKSYFEHALQPHEEIGIDGWWIDWHPKDSGVLINEEPLGWINMQHCLFHRMKDKRAFYLSRFGGVGAGRYPIVFTGDTTISWDVLRGEIGMTAAGANCLCGYISHDIGGHQKGNQEDAELYTRWLQFGVFSPILRTHACRSVKAERRPWYYAEPYHSAMRKAIQLRYDFLPYIYTEARKAFDTGLAFVRPLYYEFPENQKSYNHPDTYFFGDHMIVSPVCQPTNPEFFSVEKEIYLPEGKWYDISCGGLLEGGRVIKRSYLLDEIPLFASAGSIIPIQKDAKRTQVLPESLDFLIFPGEKGKYDLYIDNGESLSYEKGEYSYLSVSQVTNQDSCTVNISPLNGNYAVHNWNPNISIKIYTHTIPNEIEYNKKRLVHGTQNEWYYNGNESAVVINLGTLSVQDFHEVVVKFNENPTNSKIALPAILRRLEKVRFLHDCTIPDHPFFDKYLEPLYLSRCGDRITAKPANLQKELDDLVDRIKALPACIDEYMAAWKKVWPKVTYAHEVLTKAKNITVQLINDFLM